MQNDFLARQDFTKLFLTMLIIVWWQTAQFGSWWELSRSGIVLGRTQLAAPSHTIQMSQNICRKSISISVLLIITHSKYIHPKDLIINPAVWTVDTILLYNNDFQWPHAHYNFKEFFLRYKRSTLPHYNNEWFLFEIMFPGIKTNWDSQEEWK